jgi:hypothetical protein
VKIPSKDGGVDSELSDHELTEVKTLEEKKQRMKMKIEQLERDKF